MVKRVNVSASSLSACLSNDGTTEFYDKPAERMRSLKVIPDWRGKLCVLEPNRKLS